MKLPPMKSIRFQVMEVISKYGPSKAAEVAMRMPNVIRETVDGALSKNACNGLLVRTGYVYDLSDDMRDFFRLGERVGRSAPELVPPRESRVFTPEMKNYEAQMRRNWRAA